MLSGDLPGVATDLGAEGRQSRSTAAIHDYNSLPQVPPVRSSIRSIRPPGNPCVTRSIYWAYCSATCLRYDRSPLDQLRRAASARTSVWLSTIKQL
jgi:hypothetical protein